MTSLPNTMTVIAATKPGGPEVLLPETRPLPTFGADEILIRVRAAGVNRPDVMQRKGLYPPPPGAPDIIGLEIAGEVAAIGTGVTRFKVGDEVTALVPGGGYAEFCKVHETNALPVPAGFSLIEAAAIPETFFTVWPNLFQRGRLAAGETALIHGGSSGIGTTAIQLAKAFGAKVIVTAGNAEKCAACLRLGADAAINYNEEDFVAAVTAATGGRGADVILDMVGGDYVLRNYDAAADDGRIVQIATQRGPRAEIDFRLMMAKRLTHTGSMLRHRPVAFKADVAAAVHKNVWPLFEKRTVAPVIDSTFPLARAADAHARMESGAHFGKIVLTV
jgi:putative PIG3 family NAD(P)H quinone oxidoreductase